MYVYISFYIRAIQTTQYNVLTRVPAAIIQIIFTTDSVLNKSIFTFSGGCLKLRKQFVQYIKVLFDCICCSDKIMAAIEILFRSIRIYFLSDFCTR